MGKKWLQVEKSLINLLNEDEARYEAHLEADSDINAYEQIALKQKKHQIKHFLLRHRLNAKDWYTCIERGYLKAAAIHDLDDPLFPNIAYWYMRNELYCERRKEHDMPRKINYPSFVWTQKRQELLIEMCQSGTSFPDIAAHFGVDVEVVLRGSRKYNAAPSAQISKETTGPNVTRPFPLTQDAPKVDLHTQMQHLLHLVVDSANHNNDAMDALLSAKVGPCCFELGLQSAQLAESIRIIKSLMQ